MIVIDGSALFAVLLDEPDGRWCEAALLANDLVMSAGSYAEALIVAAGKDVFDPLKAFIDALEPTILPLTPERARAAAGAYRRWGKGFNPAKLNLADTFAYALATELGAPLLFTGRDFSQTDVEAVRDWIEG